MRRNDRKGFRLRLFAALVAGAVSAEPHGTAFGMFGLITGSALPLAGVIAGAPV